ncbi:MAG: class I tRNA ligase family protein [Candidatus Peribacteraceae bacterium]
MFDSVDPKQSFPDLELGILKYWSEEEVFKRSMKRRKGGEIFSFYDGPPFATGLPHYGHILAGTIKDVIPRYQTMRGKYVKRRFGWDCHGLPVENEIEKENGLKSKKDIECLGIQCFNDLCRAAVQRYTKEWRATVERLGRWVDMDWDYRTMDPEYMESIWWVFKKLHGLGLIYEGRKAMHICPRCETPLSNFEVTQGYKDVTDCAVTAKFELDENQESGIRNQAKTFLLAWTTTPWTLPGNLFLAVHPDIKYHKFKRKDGDATYIAAETFIQGRVEGEFGKVTLDEDPTPIDGKDLIGRTYKPLFPYFAKKYAGKAFKIVDGSSFVTTDEGTGIVHVAPGFGEEDYQVGKREGVEILQHVKPDGTFVNAVTDFAGLPVKPKDSPTKTDKAIGAWLKKNGKLFGNPQNFRHSYPHCWRCDSPLLNYAMTSWFVAVEKIKEKMLAANAKTHWVPGHIRDGRFGKWLEGARDWAISRSRFWGTPLPIWKNSITGETEVLGSRDELMAKCPKRFTKVIVTRHAESEGNVVKIYQGQEPGTPLTETGQKQARELGAQVQRSVPEGAPLKTIYCSPLQRTKETAEAIAAATGAVLVVDSHLHEIDFGEYEGKHVDFDDLTFVRERRAHKLEKGQVESIYHFHGMETWSSVERRFSAFLSEVLPKHAGETIVIVTHADLMMNATHLFTKTDKHKIVHQPYPELAAMRTFFWDHERKAQMDLHKETVDGIVWSDKRQATSDKQAVELTLVRHGETDFNKAKLIQGSNIDLSLNKTGKAQAKKAGAALKGTPFDLIISSDLKRAEETARIIAKETGVPFEGTNPLLRERDMGAWTGKSVDEVLATHPGILKGVRTVFQQITPPEGEPYEKFVARAQETCDLLLKKYAGKRVLLVAHGGFLLALRMVAECLTYSDVSTQELHNAKTHSLTLAPQMRRIEEVLDCWFESGAMPYAQEHFPFETGGDIPPGFPADFIAEGLDQTRGWFYTLTVLSTALFDCPAFRHCVVNGIVLAEDGKKMSKRLKNYPEPTEVVKRHGADAVRFALMSSPAVRGEDLRFSERLVEEAVRAVLLPLWNAYRLFVTYANAAEWKPSIDFSLRNGQSNVLLDRWILLKTQELVNRMTEELEQYDLSATCAHLAGSIDDLTNWYVRLSRRRLAGKEEGSAEAFDTLYRVLIANCQLLAPFCPFISEVIYLNLVTEEHGSVHFSDWPQTAPITEDDRKILSLMENTRTVTTLGLSLRSELKLRVRSPLQSVTFALSPSDSAAGVLKDLIAEELNVKQVIDVVDAASIASPIVQVDARKVGPRLGSKVQEIIREAKAGKFEEKDGSIVILGETLSPEEASIVYQGKEGKHVAADRGIVVMLDATLTDALRLEGLARELIHAIQSKRKEAGLEFTDTIMLSLTGADDILAAHKELILEETRSVQGEGNGKSEQVEVDGRTVTIRFQKKEK